MALVPGLLAAQQDPVERLREVLPADKADQVIAVVEAAQAQGLPTSPVAQLALEGVAKGRSGDEVRAAAQNMVEQLKAARGALSNSDHAASGEDIAAAQMAMAMGVDGEAISELAKSAPSERSLAVPLAVIGALVERGLPSDDALAAVLARLEARASDGEVAGMPVEASAMAAQGMQPEDIGRALASARAGFAVPPVGAVPPGPPSWVSANGGVTGDRPVPPTPPRRP